MQVGFSVRKPESLNKDARNDILHKSLIKATKRSTHRRHQTGCVITNKNGGILGTGCSHSSSFRTNELHSIHAEIHALARARFNDMNGGVAYIMTMARKSGNLTYSAPCLTCAVALIGWGITDVWYTNHDGMMEYMDLDHSIDHLKVYPRRK